PEDRRAEGPHAPAYGRGSLAQRRSRSRFTRALRLGGEPHREARQLLDRPVMDVPRDPAAFLAGCVDRSQEELLPLVAGAPDAPRKSEDERYEQDRERDERNDEHRSEVGQEL